MGVDVSQIYTPINHYQFRRRKWRRQSIGIEKVANTTNLVKMKRSKFKIKERIYGKQKQNQKWNEKIKLRKNVW